MASTSQTDSFSSRVMGVLRLVSKVYLDIAADNTATTQAAIVVAAAAIAGAIGGIRNGGEGIIGGLLTAIISWVIFASVGWFVGTRLLGAPQAAGGSRRLLRTTGFAQAPGVLSVFGAIPIIGPILAVVAGIWGLITQVMAIREGLQVSTSKAIVTAIVSFIVIVIVLALIAGVIGISLGLGGYNFDN